MLFRRKKEYQPPPPWLTWGVLAFIALAALLNMLEGKTAEIPGRPSAMSGPEAGWNFLSLDTYKTRLLPGYAQLQITDIAPGKGAAAICGQEVRVRYQVSAVPEDKTALSAFPPEDELEEASFLLGGGEAPEALQASVMNMRTGGKRAVIVPVERTVGRERAIRYAIELRAAAPELPAAPDGAMPLQVFNRRVGAAQEVRCGDTVKAYLKLWDLSGAPLLDTRRELKAPLPLKIGAAPLMIGAQLGMLGMQHDAARTLIIPPYLQQPLRPAAENKAEDSAVQSAEILHKLALPKNQTVLMEVELVP